MMNGILIASYDYDAKTRRVRKTILKTTTPYFYDGWSLVEERIANAGGTCSTNRHYWGKDLSGTLQGAGGGGGLLCLTLDGATYISLLRQQRPARRCRDGLPTDRRNSGMMPVRANCATSLRGRFQPSGFGFCEFCDTLPP